MNTDNYDPECLVTPETPGGTPSVAPVDAYAAADEVLRAIGEDRQGNVLHAFLRAVAAYPEALAAGLAAVKEERR